MVKQIGSTFITKRDGKRHKVRATTFYYNPVRNELVDIYLDEEGFAFTEDKIRKWVEG